MEVLEAIKNRCSVRHFAAEAVEKERLIQLVDMGRRAPSGRNVQPVEFVVCTDASDRQRLAEWCDNGKFIAEAPACIVVLSADTKYFLEDGCAAVENILLAATALGLGACWIAGDKKSYAAAVCEFLKAPVGFRLIALIAVGYPAQPPQPKNKRPLEQVLHWGHF